MLQMIPDKSLSFLFLLCFCVLTGSCSQSQPLSEETFRAERAMDDLITQVEFGPRFPGTQGHQDIQNWIIDTVTKANWTVTFSINGNTVPPIHNIIAEKNQAAEPWIMIGAHYDTREFADQSENEESRQLPVPGANDGASGVAILTELARSLPEDLQCQISLIFFDAEDQGQINNRDWSEGARYYVNNLDSFPDEVVIIDMVGDKDLQLYRERNSSTSLTDTIWNQADSLGYGEYFLNQPGYTMIDDHLPFLEKGILTTLIIDFDYPVWHTLQDDVDHVSLQSLQAVGETLFSWILDHPGCAPDKE